jgi:surface polysaccharide O-acyltransferase-like enzyme
MNKITWLDNLRVNATIGVILIHASATILFRFTSVSADYWWFANVYNGGYRYVVPIFVMLSGALLLPREEAIVPFLKKSFMRIIVPFLFYNFIFSLFNWQVRLRGKTFGMWDGLNWLGEQYFHGASYHFWYIYMIVGIYLFIPIIGRWIRSAPESHIQYFLGIWGLTILFNNPHFPYLKLPIALTDFTGYVGYLVLGYYLSTKNFPKGIKTWALGIFCIGTLWTLLGSYYFTAESGKFYGLLYANFSPSVVLATAGIFLFFRFQNLDISLLTPFRDWVSSHSYGIYLVHILVLFYLAKWGVYGEMLHPSIGVPLTALACLLISGGIVWVLRKIPLIKYMAG